MSRPKTGEQRYRDGGFGDEKQERPRCLSLVREVENRRIMLPRTADAGLVQRCREAPHGAVVTIMRLEAKVDCDSGIRTYSAKLGFTGVNE
jgi:hypothetical protein